HANVMTAERLVAKRDRARARGDGEIRGLHGQGVPAAGGAGRRDQLGVPTDVPGAGLDREAITGEGIAVADDVDLAHLTVQLVVDLPAQLVPYGDVRDGDDRDDRQRCGRGCCA